MIKHSVILFALLAIANASYLSERTDNLVNYDKYKPPSNTPEVRLGFNLTSLTDFSYKYNTVWMGGKITARWNDPRLAYSASNAGPNGYVVSHDISPFWNPYVRVMHVREESRLDDAQLLRHYPNGDIELERNVNYQVEQNNWDLYYWPFHALNFEFIMQCDSDNVTYIPLIENYMTIAPSLSDTQRWTISVDAVTFPGNSTSSTTSAHAKFHLKYEKVKTFTTYYYQIMAVVLLTPLAMLIGGANQLAAKLAYGASMLIAISFLEQGFNDEQPSVEYMTQQDWFITISYTYVIMQIIIFVLGDYVLFAARRRTAESISVYEVSPSGHYQKMTPKINGIDADWLWKNRATEMASKFGISLFYDGSANKNLKMHKMRWGKKWDEENQVSDSDSSDNSIDAPAADESSSGWSASGSGWVARHEPSSFLSFWENWMVPVSWLVFVVVYMGYLTICAYMYFQATDHNVNLLYIFVPLWVAVAFGGFGAYYKMRK